MGKKLFKEGDQALTTIATKESTPPLPGTLATMQPSDQSIKSDTVEQIGRNRNSSPVQVIPYTNINLCGRTNELSDCYREEHNYFEGKLLKFKPNVKSLYIDRYCVITEKHFLCYSQERCAYSPTYKPTIQLPLNSIQKVYKYLIHVESNYSQHTMLSTSLLK